MALAGPAVGRSTIATQVDAVAGGRGSVGIFSLIISLWSASAVFGAIRTGLNAAWEVTRPGPIVPRKLRDLGTVVAIGCLVLISLALTGVLTAIEAFGLHLVRATSFGHLTHVLSALRGLGYTTRVRRVRRLRAWNLLFDSPGKDRDSRCLARRLGCGGPLSSRPACLQRLCVTKIAHYDRLYGSLGAAVIAFLFFTYIGANILLCGGELTKAYSEARLRAGEQDQPPLPGMQPGLSGRLIAVLKRIVREPLNFR